MKILLIGADGQVGWELSRALQPLGEVLALTRRTTPAADLASPETVTRIIASMKPDAIVNAAAYTAVDRAEDEPDVARQANATAPQALAEAAKQAGSLFVHYSTDYVFDGSGQSPWREDQPTNPLNQYGHTKREGELAIEASGCQHLVFRTSWVYATRGRNFIRTILDLAKTREELKIVSDQIGAPTGAELIADVTAHAIVKARSAPSLSGIYHLTSQGETSWHGLADFALAEARKLGWELAVKRLLPIPSHEYPQKAKRPLNSRMATGKLCSAFDLAMPEWQTGVARVIKEWT